MLALIFMALIYFFPVADMAQSAVFVKDYPVLIVIEILVAVLLFVSIFTFRNLRLQKKVTLLSMVLMCSMAVAGGFFLYRDVPQATLEWGGGITLLVLAVIFALLAYRGMSRDQRKLAESRGSLYSTYGKRK